jgi:hypothetical protein
MHDLKKNNRRQRRQKNQLSINAMSHYFERQKNLNRKDFQKSLKAHLRGIFKLGNNPYFPENTNRFVLISQGGDCIGR